jgi:hypothetical protein
LAFESGLGFGFRQSLTPNQQHLQFAQFDLCWFVWLMQVAWLVV